jgi:hypothetical protein
MGGTYIDFLYSLAQNSTPTNNVAATNPATGYLNQPTKGVSSAFAIIFAISGSLHLFQIM